MEMREYVNSTLDVLGLRILWQLDINVFNFVLETDLGVNVEVVAEVPI